LKRGTFRSRLNRIPMGLSLFLALVSLLFAGCGTLPSHYGSTMPPVTSFPPVKPSLVRLPVEVVFPSGGDVFQHISNLFKGGIKQIMPDLRGLPGLSMDSHITDFWEKIQEPIFLEKDTWLLIRPATLSIGMMRTDLKRASTIHTVLEMTAKPEIIFGAKPLTTPKGMPPLQPFKPGPGIFEAMTNTRISWEEATRYLLDPRLKLVGKVFPGTGDRKVTLQGFRFSGSGGKAMIKVKLHYNPLVINLGGKPADLTLYLRGTPRYLPKQRVFDFPDLDYDIKSGDLVVQVADWLNKSDFTKRLRRYLKIPIGPKMDEFKARMNKVLNRRLSPFTRLNTQVNSFKVLGAFADNEGFEVRLSVQGTAILEVIWN
jgi:hypothetical protein